jgi:hypothetical protein
VGWAAAVAYPACATCSAWGGPHHVKGIAEAAVSTWPTLPPSHPATQPPSQCPPHRPSPLHVPLLQVLLPEAYYHLGIMHLKGLGVKVKSAQRAFNYFNIAAHGGHLQVGGRGGGGWGWGGGGAQQGAAAPGARLTHRLSAAEPLLQACSAAAALAPPSLAVRLHWLPGLCGAHTSPGTNQRPVGRRRRPCTTRP